MLKLDVTSLQNPRVKHVVKLREAKRVRQREKLMIVEGWDELSAALSTGLVPETILTCPELTSRKLEVVPIPVLTVTRRVFEKISYRENPDGWLAILPIPQRELSGLVLTNPPLVVVVEAVEKPGNLGAILRTADAAAVDALLVTDPRLDLWNPNVIRASRGAVFTVPAVEVENKLALSWLRSQGMTILGASPNAVLDYTRVDLAQPVAIVVGTEDKGLSEFWLSNADHTITIPMFGRVNSLNVSTAAAIMVYETLRQRGITGH